MMQSDVEFMVARNRYALMSVPCFVTDMLMAPIVAWTDKSGPDSPRAVFVAALHPGRPVDATSSATPLCAVTREPTGSSPTAFGYLNDALPAYLVDAIASTGLLGVMVPTVGGRTACTLNGFGSLPNITGARVTSYGLVAQSPVGDVAWALRSVMQGLHALGHDGGTASAWHLASSLDACCDAVDGLYASGTVSRDDADRILVTLDRARSLLAVGPCDDARQVRRVGDELSRARAMLLSSVVADMRVCPATLACRSESAIEGCLGTPDMER